MTFIYNSPINFNIPKPVFKAASPAYTPNISTGNDSFVTNPLNDKFGTKAQIEAEIKSNPRIMEIMRENNLPIKVNTQELENLTKGHLKDTRITAAKIYSSLPQDLKNDVNLKDLQEAAMFHDYGKILIPEKILNKAGKLTEDESKIINLHSELGYELLKNKGLSENTLNLIKYHHQKPDNSGYPEITNDYRYNLESEILTTADKYTALREKRSYKDALSHQEALNVLQGEVSKEVYNALTKIS